MKRYQSATKLFLIGFGLIIGIAFLIIVFFNSTNESIIAGVTSTVTMIAGGLIGYFFKHNKDTKDEQTTSQ